MAPGFVGDSSNFDLAALMLQIYLSLPVVRLPYRVCRRHSKYLRAIRCSSIRTPVILNVVLITAAIWVAPLLEEPVMALAYGILVAGILLLFQLPLLSPGSVRSRVRVWRAPRGHTAFRAPDGAGYFWLIRRADQRAAWRHDCIAGGISYLYFSDRLMEFSAGLVQYCTGGG